MTTPKQSSFFLIPSPLPTRLTIFALKGRTMPLGYIMGSNIFNIDYRLLLYPYYCVLFFEIERKKKEQDENTNPKSIYMLFVYYQ